MTRRRRVRPADVRLRRLLVMLPWLMEQGSVPLVDVAQRFDLEPDEVVADLELASMCGLPPYVDELIDVFIDEGTVHVGVPRLFTRPLRLNAREAFELLAAARVAMELPGADPDGPLGRGLSKLAVLTGLASTSEASTEPDGSDRRAGSGAASDDVVVELSRSALVDELVAAAHRGEVLDVDYWSAERDDTTARRILPRQVFADRGNWYVVAEDDRSGAVRTFRADRILACRATGERREPAEIELPRPGEWFVDAAVPRAVLRLRPPARWIVERYPVDTVDDAVDDAAGGHADDTIVVTLPVASRRWFERLVLRLGPDAEVIEPPELADLARSAAARVLAVYRDAVPDAGAPAST